MVKTIYGEQAIGKLHVGEKVLAYNFRTDKMEWQPIEHIWIHQDNDLVDLTITTIQRTQYEKKTKRPGQIYEVIHTNKKHPFFTLEKGFLSVEQIKIGMHILGADGRIGIITAWTSVPGEKTMYNLEIAQDHTFTVGTGEWIVHNDCGSFDNKILKMFDSTDPGVHTEGEMALITRMEGYDVVNLNQKINGPEGTVGEIDAETQGAILEAKSGDSWSSKNTEQIQKLLNNPQLNPSGKPVIIYAPNFSDANVARAEAAGAIVARNED